MKLHHLFCTALMLTGLFLVSGCIKMNVTQSIQPSGTAHLRVVYDMTAMVESFQDIDESGQPEDLSIIKPEDAAQSCEDFKSEATWSNATCTVEGYVFTMEGDVQLESPAFEVIASLGKTTYQYDLKNLYTLLESVGDSQGQDFSEEGLQTYKDYVEYTGIELTYSLQMPGNITQTNVGEIQDDGSTVVIDLFDMAGMESATVVAEEKNVSWLWIGVGGGVIILGLGGFLALKKKKGDSEVPIDTAPAQ